MVCDPLTRSIKYAGSQRKLSKEIGLKNPRVLNNWLNSGIKIPLIHAIVIEAYTNGQVKAEELAPYAKPQIQLFIEYLLKNIGMEVMRDYGSIRTQFWIADDISHLSDQAKLLALYLLSGPHTNMLGCFRLPPGYIAEDLRWSIEVVNKALNELYDAAFINYDKKSHWLVVQQFLKWNPVENPNQAKKIVKLFSKIPMKTTIFQTIVDALLNHTKYLENEFIQYLQSLSEKRQNTNNHETSFIASTVIIENAIEQVEQSLPIIAIPLADKTEFSITNAQIKQWEELYPGIDVLQTLRHIRAWNLANPKKRKTKSGILKHINYWLSKAQNRGHKVIMSTTNNTLFDHNHAVAEEWLRTSDFPIEDEVSDETK